MPPTTNFQIYAPADACADTDPKVHRVLTERDFLRQATFIAMADLPGLLSAG